MYTIIYFLFAFICLLKSMSNVKKEMFTNYNYNDPNYIYKLDLEKKYVPDHLKVSILKRQKHLDFLGTLKDRVDQLSPKIGTGSCDNKIK
jgi:hypothetical protein